MTGPVGVLGAGAAFASLRLAIADIAAAWGERGGSGHLAVCAADEDPLTLGHLAGERALRAAGVDAADVDALYFGLTRPPYAEGPTHAFLAAALGLGPGSGGALLAGSAHSGMEALLAGWDAVAAGSSRRALVVVADALRPGPGTLLERSTGAAAAALLLAPAAASTPAVLHARVTRTEPVQDSWRGDSENDTRDVYDGRLYREQVFLPAVAGMAADLGAGVTGWSLPDPDGRLGAAAARRIGVPPPTLTRLAGWPAAAGPLLGALPLLAAPGEVAVLGHGGGRTTGLCLQVRTAVPGAGPLEEVLGIGCDAS
ncbi:MAG: hypothetical protein ACYDB7_05425, partial [Mycobacteriales bacterium]